MWVIELVLCAMSMGLITLFIILILQEVVEL